jgi:hypothetical protein
MKKLKTIEILLVLFFLSANSIFSQNTFKYTIKDPSTDEVVYDGIELANESYILTCIQMESIAYFWKVHLVRISNSGNLLGSTEFQYQGQNSGFMSVHQIQPNLFLFAGITVDGSKNKIWIYETDSLFNAVNNKVITLDTCSFSSVDIFSDESGNFLLPGILRTPSNIPYAYIYKLSPNLDSLAFKIFTDYPVLFQPSLLRKVDNSGYYFFLEGYCSVWSGYDEAILDLDNSFSIVKISGVPHQLAEAVNSKWINKKSFIITGRRFFIPNPNDQCVGVLSLDTNYSLNHELIIGDHDTVEWTGRWKNLDYIDTNNIYVGGIHNFCEFEICNQISWFSLTNMDSSLNVRWEKFYGGNAYYVLWGIKATTDGGCIMYGSIYDSATQVNERDIYVIKVDQNGLVGIDDKKLNPLAHDAIVFPNPGSDYLNIESGPQISGAQFRLVTLNGTQVISKFLNERMIKIDAQSLSSGTYLWEIIFKGGVIENGKWIKN